MITRILFSKSLGCLTSFSGFRYSIKTQKAPQTFNQEEKIVWSKITNSKSFAEISETYHNHQAGFNRQILIETTNILLQRVKEKRQGQSKYKFDQNIEAILSKYVKCCSFEQMNEKEILHFLKMKRTFFMAPSIKLENDKLAKLINRIIQLLPQTPPPFSREQINRISSFYFEVCLNQLWKCQTSIINRLYGITNMKGKEKSTLSVNNAALILQTHSLMELTSKKQNVITYDCLVLINSQFSNIPSDKLIDIAQSICSLNTTNFEERNFTEIKKFFTHFQAIVNSFNDMQLLKLSMINKKRVQFQYILINVLSNLFEYVDKSGSSSILQSFILKIIKNSLNQIELRKFKDESIQKLILFLEKCYKIEKDCLISALVSILSNKNNVQMTNLYFMINKVFEKQLIPIQLAYELSLRKFNLNSFNVPLTFPENTNYQPHKIREIILSFVISKIQKDLNPNNPLFTDGLQKYKSYFGEIITNQTNFIALHKYLLKSAKFIKSLLQQFYQTYKQFLLALECPFDESSLKKSNFYLACYCSALITVQNRQTDGKVVSFYVSNIRPKLTSEVIRLVLFLENQYKQKQNIFVNNLLLTSCCIFLEESLQKSNGPFLYDLLTYVKRINSVIINNMNLVRTQHDFWRLMLMMVRNYSKICKIAGEMKMLAALEAYVGHHSRQYELSAEYIFFISTLCQVFIRQENSGFFRALRNTLFIEAIRLGVLKDKDLKFIKIELLTIPVIKNYVYACQYPLDNFKNEYLIMIVLNPKNMKIVVENEQKIIQMINSIEGKKELEYILSNFNLPKNQITAKIIDALIKSLVQKNLITPRTNLIGVLHQLNKIGYNLTDQNPLGMAVFRLLHSKFHYFSLQSHLKIFIYLSSFNITIDRAYQQQIAQKLNQKSNLYYHYYHIINALIQTNYNLPIKTVKSFIQSNFSEGFKCFILIGFEEQLGKAYCKEFLTDFVKNVESKAYKRIQLMSELDFKYLKRNYPTVFNHFNFRKQNSKTSYRFACTPIIPLKKMLNVVCDVVGCQLYSLVMDDLVFNEIYLIKDVYIYFLPRHRTGSVFQNINEKYLATLLNIQHSQIGHLTIIHTAEDPLEAIRIIAKENPHLNLNANDPRFKLNYYIVPKEEIIPPKPISAFRQGNQSPPSVFKSIAINANSTVIAQRFQAKSNYPLFKSANIQKKPKPVKNNQKQAEKEVPIEIKHDTKRQDRRYRKQQKVSGKIFTSQAKQTEPKSDKQVFSQIKLKSDYKQDGSNKKSEKSYSPALKPQGSQKNHQKSQQKNEGLSSIQPKPSSDSIFD